MDKQNKKPDSSKKRKRGGDKEKTDNSEGVIKRHRIEENEGESTTTIRLSQNRNNATEPNLSFTANNPPSGCSYNWRPQTAEVQETKLEPQNANMEWRQETETEMEEDYSGFNEETAEVFDEEYESSCNLVSRIVHESEDESWEDDFVLRLSCITVREPQEPSYGPQKDPTYNPETAMEEGWDWPDPDEVKTEESGDTHAQDADVVISEDWGVPSEIAVESLINEDERLMNEEETGGEQNDADKDNMDA